MELELKVRVLNINEGFNTKLKEQCPILAEYMQYVDCVRRYNKDYPLDEAVPKAVDECIKKGILRDFLIRNKAEVTKVSIYEYDEEEVRKLLREEAKEEGYEEGQEKGLAEGREKGLAEGLAEGRAEGRAEGHMNILTLMQKLFAAGRVADAERASNDKAYCSQLLAEYGLVK